MSIRRTGGQAEASIAELNKAVVVKIGQAVVRIERAVIVQIVLRKCVQQGKMVVLLEVKPVLCTVLCLRWKGKV